MGTFLSQKSHRNGKKRETAMAYSTQSWEHFCTLYYYLIADRFFNAENTRRSSLGWWRINVNNVQS